MYKLVLPLLMAVCLLLGLVTTVATAAVAQSGSGDADKVCLVGDIDNLGFQFPSGYDVFSGSPTRSHSYPWPSSTNRDPSPNDPSGTDRIMAGTSVKASPNGGHAKANDGYTGGTKRADTFPQALKLSCDRGSVSINSLAMQLFVDDFQPTVFHSKFTATINGKHFRALEEIINSLNQTGPQGKLITVAVPSSLVNDVLRGDLLIDDATTGIGDGYAIDFERTLINPHLTSHVGTVTGRVTDVTSGKPIEGAIVSAGGTLQATTAADGDYTIDNVAAGLAVLTATAPGHIHKTSAPDLVGGGAKTAEL